LSISLCFIPSRPGRRLIRWILVGGGRCRTLDGLPCARSDALARSICRCGHSLSKTKGRSRVRNPWNVCDNFSGVGRSAVRVLGISEQRKLGSDGGQLHRCLCVLLLDPVLYKGETNLGKRRNDGLSDSSFSSTWRPNSIILGNL